MRLTTSLLALIGMAALPAVSHGQSYKEPAYPRTGGRDVAYCQELSNIYVRYVGHDWQYGRHVLHRADNDAQVASTQCHTDPTFAISILERELRANKLGLPARG